MRMAAFRGWWGLVVVGACGRVEAPVAPVQAQASARVTVAQRLTLSLPGTAGVSGSAVDAQGRLFAVAERQAFLLPLKLAGVSPGLAEAKVPIVGIPEGFDTESLAFVRPDLLAIGTETWEEGRSEDAVLLASLALGRVTVTDRLSIHYADFGLDVEDNQGLEGLCSAGETLVAALETPLESPRGRFAALFRAALAERLWQVTRLRLTTSTGKISALDCRADADGLQVIAIERHYGVAKLLLFHLPTGALPSEVEPQVVADLDALIDELPNLEGVTFAGAGQVVLLVDNDSGGITGPNEAIVVQGVWNAP